jgi:hypothetical protein
VPSIVLHDLELRLKPEHPDVIRQKKFVAGLQQRAEAEALRSPVSPDRRCGLRRRSAG